MSASVLPLERYIAGDSHDEAMGPCYAIPSDTSPGKTWPVYPDVPMCACWPFQKSGRECKHIYKARLLQAAETSDYLRAVIDSLQTRTERLAVQRFGSLQDFLDYCIRGQGEPYNRYLSNIFLALLYCQRTGTGTTDLIHYAVNEKFCGSPRRVAGVTKGLMARGLIEWGGHSVPSQRKLNHGSMKRIYRITDLGRRYVEGGEI